MDPDLSTALDEIALAIAETGEQVKEIRKMLMGKQPETDPEQLIPTGVKNAQCPNRN